MPVCDYCEKEVSMPYGCRYCGGSFCPKHRLPENHDCDGLDGILEKTKREGKIYRDVREDLENDSKDKPKDGSFDITFDLMRRSEERRSEQDYRREKGIDFSLSNMIKKFLFSNTTFILILIMVAVYVAQVLLYSIGGINLYSQVISYFAPTKANFITRPWTLVTSIFLHDVSNPLHILVNSLFLFFVGQALERRVGRKRLLYLFFGGGILASIAQIPLLPEGFVLIGASGAVFAVIGGLTAISPKMPIFLFFLLPIPLWMFAVGYGIHELAQALIGDGNVAHMAHFAGLLIGAGYGYKLRKDFGKKFGRSRSPFTF